MSTLIEEKQRTREAVNNFVERFRNLSLRCPEGMPLSILLHTYIHNLGAKIESKNRYCPGSHMERTPRTSRYH